MGQGTRGEAAEGVMNDDEWIVCPECNGEGYEDAQQGDPPWTGFIRVNCDVCNSAGGWYEPIEDDDPYEPWKA